MKQKQLLKPLFLLCALLVGGLNSLWAAEASFAPSDFSGQGTSGTGSAISATVDGVTFACDKGYGTTQVRCYSGGKITISSSNTITAISFTFSGSYTGGLETSYTGLSATSWEKTLSSQARITAVTVTYSTASSTAVETTTTIDASGITNTDVYLSTKAGSLSATVKDEDDNTVKGATVTWSGNNDAVATIDASTGAVTLVDAGTVTFTASYAGDDANYKPSSDTYEMTVTNSAPYVQPLTVEITPNYTFWGQSAQFSGSTYNALSGSKDNVELSWSRGSGSTYANNSAMRFYKDNTLTFTAPTGYVIKSILIDGTLQNDETFSPGSFDSNSMTWTGKSATVTMSRPSNGSSYATITKYTITLEEASNLPTPTVTISGDLTLDLNGGTNVSAGTLTAAVTYNDAAVQGATVTWSSSDPEVATIDENGDVTLLKTGEVTFTATFAETTEYNEATGTKTITVTDSKAPGSSAENAYTVEQAIAAIDAGTGVTGVYATGIVSEIVTAYNSQYGNISYNISADGSTSGAQLQAYRGKSYNGENFTSEDDIQVGDVVVVYGNLKKHNSTYEFDADNQLVSLNRPTNPIITASDVELTYDATSGEVAYEVANTVTGVSLTATTDADWISNISVADDKVTFTTTANEGTTDRTATITLSYTGATDKEITVTQAHFVADYATLPFEYNDGKPSNISGLTQSGLGTDYSSSPKMRFDTTGDELVLRINEAPGKLTFDIKGNSFSGGTFTLQASADGETYSDVATYTELGETQHEVITTLDSDVRYIKWVYTEKSSGNVALGNITLYKLITVTISSVGYKAYNTTADTDFSGTGVKAYVVTGYTTESVTLEEVTAAPEGTPLVLKADGGDYTLYAAEETPAAPANLLQVSNGTVGDGSTIYALANVNGPGFYVVKEGLTIPTNYIEIPAGYAPALSFDFGEGTTGIRSIENGQLTIDNVYYDLSGRKLNAMPTQKGVYIVNGKKVVIK